MVYGIIMEQVQLLVKKLCVSPQARHKAMEYLRLAELKCPADLPPSCLAAICVEIACDQQGDLVDRVRRMHRHHTVPLP